MKTACHQMDVRLGKPSENVAAIEPVLNRLSAEAVDLVIFPEAALTGYAVDSREEALGISIAADGVEISHLQSIVDSQEIACIVGFIENERGACYNSAALLQPRCPPFIYRKTHLPFLGVDRFVKPGDSIQVVQTKFGCIGILVCFDMRFPETFRELALQGADLIVLPTNWPEGAETSAQHVCIARAAENKVYVATCNRVGEENGFTFIGQSKIIGPNGAVLASASAEATTIEATIELELARDKRTVIRPGSYEIDVMARRPELYGSLAKSPQ